MKFLHAADIHLDSPMQGLERYEGAPVEQIRGATRIALERMVDLARDEEVDFVLIAGDLYDGDWKDFNTGLFFSRQMNRLREAEIPVYLIRGNHDAANRMTLSLTLPDNVKMLSFKKHETVVDEDDGVVIHGQGFASQAVQENLARQYSDPHTGYFNIGLLHTNVDGRPGHDNYAPCALTELVNKGYDYWALGHIHMREILHQNPWVAYPGNLQGRHVRETGPKGCYLVSVEDGRIASVDFQPLDTVRWAICSVDIHIAQTPDDAVELAIQRVERELSNLTSELLAVRIEFMGESKAHSDLIQEPFKWNNEIRNHLFQFGDAVWLESIRYAGHATVDLRSVEQRDDAVGELMRMLREVQVKPDMLEEFKKDVIEPLYEKIPWEARSGDDFNLLDAGYLASRLEDVKHLIFRRLLREEAPR